jgi:hypothetical protein
VTGYAEHLDDYHLDTAPVANGSVGYSGSHLFSIK